MKSENGTYRNPPTASTGQGGGDAHAMRHNHRCPHSIATSTPKPKPKNKHCSTPITPIHTHTHTQFTLPHAPFTPSSYMFTDHTRPVHTCIHALPRERRVSHAVQPSYCRAVEGHGQHAQGPSGWYGAVGAVMAVQETAVRAGRADLRKRWDDYVRYTVCLHVCFEGSGSGGGCGACRPVGRDRGGLCINVSGLSRKQTL